MNTKKILIVLAAILGLQVFAVAQTAPASSEDEYEKEYQKRLQKEYLFGVYIPKDLTDAFIQLNKLIDDESKAKFKSLDEADAVKRLHFSFGRWMTYNWSFYEGSRFSAYLKKLGIHHPEDMATFVMISYHRNLNRKSLDVKQQINQIHQKRKAERDAKLQGGEVLHQEKRKRNGGE